MDKYIERLKVPSFLIDCNMRLRPAAFMSIAQEIAGRGAEALGMGYDDLAAHGLAWIVSRMHIEFVKPAVWEQDVEIQTWHRGIESLFSRREYQLLDAQTRETLASATCAWLILDTNNRKLFRTDRFSELFDTGPQCEEYAVPCSAPRLRMPKDMEAEFIRTHKVRFSDLDFNHHVNNAAYLTWTMDSLPDEYCLHSYPKSLDINFILETRPNESVDIYRSIKTSENGTEIFVEGKTGEQTHFICRLIY